MAPTEAPTMPRHQTACAALLLTLAACNAPTEPAATAPTPTASAAPAPAAVVPAPVSPIDRPAMMYAPIQVVEKMGTDPGWQYVVRRDEMRQTVKVEAVMSSEPVTDDTGNLEVMLLNVTMGDEKPAVMLSMGNAFNACHENTCPVALRTDVTPFENARLLSMGIDHGGWLARDDGREDIATLLTRARLILLEVDVMGEGKRVVRFTPPRPLVLPLPPPPPAGG